MPTPVTVARQCLTPDAAHALDEAVSVARRRGHAQTTSLHAVSALLSLPSSVLREACSRARNCAYSPRLQFKALELCLSVSLDRVSSSQLTDDPPVSNSLMAAIKRSQANQRRQPENFHLYHQLPHAQHSSSSVAVVKVELQHLLLSILDDPVVSRVFSEAGFRSSEIKLAVIRPLPSHLYKFPRSRGPPPPIFLCNYPGENSGPGQMGLGGFTFPGFGGFLGGDDENRRIGEVLVKRRKNPLLLGVCANAALKSFRESVEENNKNENTKNNDNIKKTTSVLPVELSGLNMVSIEKDVSRYITENGDEKSLSVRFEEVGMLIEQNSGPGVVVNYGDLKVFVDGGDDNNDNTNDNENGGGKSDAVSHVVAHLSRLVQLYGVKVWLIGAAATYEMYSKFVSRFPSIDKDWNLELLPITSLRPSSMAGSFPKSSLMESFVPFGGFFSTPSDFKSPLNSLYQSVYRCHQCNDKCEQEIAAYSKGGSTDSIADQYQSSLPSWLQMAEQGTNKGLDLEAKDDRGVLSAKATGVQKKWDDICRSLHHSRPIPNPSICQVGSQFPTVMGFQFLEDKLENAYNCSINTTNAPPNENSCVNVNSGIPIDLERISASNSVLAFPTVSKSKNESFLSKLLEKPLKADAESGGLRSACSLSNSSVGDGSQASPTSVTTDLGLGLSSAPMSSDPKKHIDEDHTELSPELFGCFSANVDIVDEHLPAQSSSSSCPDLLHHFDLSNFKMLFSALSERVGWQDEAVGMISQIIANCRKGNENRHGASARADIWFNFAGPDKPGKRKIAIALAEIIYGSKENLICADLSFQDGVRNTSPIFSHQDASGYCMEFRGKTLVDYIAAELCKKPLSVVFLENIDKADVEARSSLSKAIQTGKFSDLHGREVSISNAIFVTTSALKKDIKIFSSGTYSEERILRAKSWPIQIQIEPALGNRNNSQITMKKDLSYPIWVNKRKLIGSNDYPEQQDVSEMVKRAHRSPATNLDLNLPAEEDEAKDAADGNSDHDSSECSKSWLHDFFDRMVETVVFKQFDFDALAKNILKDINESFHKIVGPKCSLEIDSKVMEQLLAAAYFSEGIRVVEDWTENVLSWEFLEVRKRYNISSHSIVKLVTCLDKFPEEPTPPGVCLPPNFVVVD